MVHASILKDLAEHKIAPDDYLVWKVIGDCLQRARVGLKTAVFYPEPTEYDLDRLEKTLVGLGYTVRTDYFTDEIAKVEVEW